jgi:glyoxylase-like metal-dependent hydrolase (beta-lactamase superfamily II)
MNKLLKITLWSAGIVVGLVLIVAIVFLFNFISATKAMTPGETQSINDSVWCVRDKFVNAFIFKGKDGYILIDAGISEKNFRNELAKTGIQPDQITTLLLTHTDGDHIGATGLFRNAAIYLHKDEEQMINGTTGKTKFSKTKWKYGPYKLLGSDETVILNGIKVKIIHTPGHTPGSSCFIIGEDYLVTGDNLIVQKGKYVHFVEKFNMDTPEQEESLKILPDASTFKYIMTGHNGIVKNPATN